MSFTTTAYYRNYETRDPLVQVRNDLVLANSNIMIGAKNFEIADAGTTVVPAYNLLNNTIVRTTNSDNLQTDTAANLLAALRSKLKAQISQNFSDAGTVPNGTRFTVTVLNKSGGSFDFQDNSAGGVDYDNTGTEPIGNNRGQFFIFTVVNQILLGDATDNITICQTDDV
jgi:hypothetical protein